MSDSQPLELTRRDLLKLSAMAGAGASLAGLAATAGPTAAMASTSTDFSEFTIAQMDAGMAAHQFTSLDLVNFYLNRIQNIDQSGPRVNSVIQVNPDAQSIAQELDAERRAGKVRGPMHGIPVLLKDNIDTNDQLQTAAGSLGLVGTPALKDATMAANLRAAGAVILGKTTLSEWANFRSSFSSSGWSGRGGQCNNPYAVDRNPCGSSSGSGAATSANFTAVSIGTETDGSIVCPANENGVAAIKPTVGLVSRAGVVPISHTQDTVGPHARTVADAAIVLNAVVQRKPDPRDPATRANRQLIPADYTAFLDPTGAKLAGTRIGVGRDFEGSSPNTDAVFENALTALRNAGAVLVDVSFPHIGDINSGLNEFTVLLFDFKGDLQNYLGTRVGVPLAHGTLADAIAFNIAHAAQEMPFFGQDVFLLAEQFNINDPNTTNQPLGISYNQAISNDRLFGATEGIDQLLQQNNLAAIVAPTDTAAWPTDLINGDHFVFGSSSPAAIVGYPIAVVPMGNEFGLPVGLSIMGTAFSEPTLIRIASGFEAVTKARIVPKFLSTLPLNTRPASSTTAAAAATTTQRQKSQTGRAAPFRI